MFRPHTLLPVAALALLLASACSLRGTGSTEDSAKQTDACVECQQVLVECASTSTTEQDFLMCRQQWQSCQEQRGLGTGECQNPQDADACSLCRSRLLECTAAAGDDAQLCDEQFGVCKSLLMTRSDLLMECSAEAPKPDAMCGICRDDFVACVSDGAAENIGVCEPCRSDAICCSCWRRRLKAMLVDHSKYRHQAYAVRTPSDGIAIVSQGSYGSFVESIDATTGTQRGRWQLD